MKSRDLLADAADIVLLALFGLCTISVVLVILSIASLVLHSMGWIVLSTETLKNLRWSATGCFAFLVVMSVVVYLSSSRLRNSADGRHKE